MINTIDKAIVLEFKRKLPRRNFAHLKKLIVFGSRIKSNAPEDSDLDLVALVDKKTLKLEQELEDVAYQVMWDHDFRPIISLKVFAEKTFYSAVEKGFSFYLHVNRDGIVI